VKSFWHDYEHEDVSAIYYSLPAKLAPLARERAFLMEDVTFGGWHDGTAWTLAATRSRWPTSSRS